MARPLRLLVAGGLYHVTTSATGNDWLFRNDDERGFFLRLVGDVVTRLQWRCRSYCVLGTHYHLMVETPEPNLDRGMKRLNGLYAQWFNRQHERTGHLVADRYHSVLVERESHAIQIVRYIARNPIRAGLCRSPEAWPWSSYAATIGEAPAPVFLDAEELVRWFSPRRGAGVRRLRAFVEDS
jgi:REP-associated tyrosine transposase